LRVRRQRPDRAAALASLADRQLQRLDAGRHRWMRGQVVGEGRRLAVPGPERLEEFGGAADVSVAALEDPERVRIGQCLAAARIPGLAQVPGRLQHARRPRPVPGQHACCGDQHQAASDRAQVVAVGQVGQFVGQDEGQAILRAHMAQQAFMHHHRAAGEDHGVGLLRCHQAHGCLAGQAGAGAQGVEPGLQPGFARRRVRPRGRERRRDQPGEAGLRVRTQFVDHAVHQQAQRPDPGQHRHRQPGQDQQEVLERVLVRDIVVMLRQRGPVLHAAPHNR
jgi:hypothetical protein